MNLNYSTYRNPRLLNTPTLFDDGLEDPVVDEMIILKWISKKYGRVRRELD